MGELTIIFDHIFVTKKVRYFFCLLAFKKVIQKEKKEQLSGYVIFRDRSFKGIYFGRKPLFIPLLMT